MPVVPGNTLAIVVPTLVALEDKTFEKNEIFNEEKALADEIRESYEKAVWHYFSTTGIEIPENGALTNSSYCKYDANLDFLKNNILINFFFAFISLI